MRLLLLLPVLVHAVKRDRGTPTPDHARAWLGLHADQEQQMQYGHHDVQRRNLHDWLLGGNYEGLLLSLVDANPALVEYLRRWTISYAHYDSSLAERMRRDAANRLNFEVLLSVLLNMLNQQVTPHLVALLSLLALKCRVPKEFWDVLSRVGVLKGRTWTRILATELGQTLAAIPPVRASRVVAKVAYDNLLLKFNSLYEGTSDAYRRIVYQTIQTTRMHVMDVDDEAVNDALIDGSWNDRGPTLRIEEWLCDIPAGDAYKASAWDHFIDLEPIATLYHPDHARTADVRAVDLPHIHTRAGTAAYDDNEQALTQIMNIMVHTLKFKCVFVVGDQQSFIRMVSLIRGNPKLYKWLIPLPGEFHFEVHALMAVHRLCWKCLVRWIVQVAEICPKSCNVENWGEVAHYNRFHHLYNIIIVALLTYVRGIVPRALLGNYPLLLELASENKGLCVILVVLHDFLLPWLSLRQSIRTGRSRNIDELWRVTMPWFMATNKHCYRDLCIDYIYVLVSMVPSLRAVHDAQSRASASRKSQLLL